MKTRRYHNFGGPELLREDEVLPPEPSEGEVLIKLAATSVNPADWKIGEASLRGSEEAWCLRLRKSFFFSGTIG